MSLYIDTHKSIYILYIYIYVYVKDICLVVFHMHGHIFREVSLSTAIIVRIMWQLSSYKGHYFIYDFLSPGTSPGSFARKYLYIHNNQWLPFIIFCFVLNNCTTPYLFCLKVIRQEYFVTLITFSYCLWYQYTQYLEWSVNSLHKRPVTRKMFSFDDVILAARWIIFLIFVAKMRQTIAW